jgi:aquaporin Z
VVGGLMKLIASSKPGFAATGNMAANGYGIHSPRGGTVPSRPSSPRFC